jgi:hypothetical protein
MALKRRLPSSNRPPPANHLLAALPAAEYARLAPTLRNTPLKLKRFLHNPGDPIDRVYFPGGGVTFSGHGPQRWLHGGGCDDRS